MLTTSGSVTLNQFSIKATGTACVTSATCITRACASANPDIVASVVQLNAQGGSVNVNTDQSTLHPECEVQPHGAQQRHRPDHPESHQRRHHDGDEHVCHHGLHADGRDRHSERRSGLPAGQEHHGGLGGLQRLRGERHEYGQADRGMRRHIHCGASGRAAVNGTNGVTLCSSNGTGAVALNQLSVQTSGTVQVHAGGAVTASGTWNVVAPTLCVTGTSIGTAAAPLHLNNAGALTLDSATSSTCSTNITSATCLTVAGPVTGDPPVAWPRIAGHLRRQVHHGQRRNRWREDDLRLQYVQRVRRQPHDHGDAHGRWNGAASTTNTIAGASSTGTGVSLNGATVAVCGTATNNATVTGTGATGVAINGATTIQGGKGATIQGSSVNVQSGSNAVNLTAAHCNNAINVTGLADAYGTSVNLCSNVTGGSITATATRGTSADRRR